MSEAPQARVGRARGEKDAAAASDATAGLTNVRTRIVGTREGLLAELLVSTVRAARTVGAAIASTVTRVVQVVTPAGWTVLGLVPLGLVVGYRFGWIEAVILGWAALVLIITAALYLFRRAVGRVDLSVDHLRATVGDTVEGSVTTTNPGRTRTGGGIVEVPVGGSVIEIPVGSEVVEVLLPALGARASESRPFPIPTSRRGRLSIGPARSVRADPFGLVRRVVEWSGAVPLVVHPRTVTIQSVAAGRLRDLEGTTTNQLTASDIAFHALREYQAGDDRRYVHWRTTARTGQLMVRQFEETRRSQLLVALTLAQNDYASDEEFELAVSVAGSIGARAIRDTRDVSFVASARTPEYARRKVFALAHLSTVTRERLLDDLADVERDAAALTVLDVARVASSTLPSISSAFLVTGSATPITVVRAAAAMLPAGVPVTAIVCEPEAVPELRRLEDLAIVRVGYLDDLRGAMDRAVRT